MSFDITRQSLFRTILYFLFMFIIFRSREYLFIPQAESREMTLIGEWVYGILERYPILDTIIALFLSFINSFFLTRIISQNLIFIERTYMPSLIYIMVGLGYYSSTSSTITLGVAFLLIFALDNLILSYKQNYRLGNFFNASFSLGFSIILYAPSVLFIILLLILLIVFRANSRETIVSFIGIFTPLFFASYIEWGLGGEFMRTSRDILDIAFSGSWIPNMITSTLWDFILLGIYIMITITSLIAFIKRRESMRKRSHTSYITFIWTFVISVIMISLPSRNFDMVPIIAAPLAVVIPTYFNRKEGVMPNLLYAIILFSLLIYNIVPLVNQFLQ